MPAADAAVEVVAVADAAAVHAVAARAAADDPPLSVDPVVVLGRPNDLLSVQLNDPRKGRLSGPQTGQRNAPPIQAEVAHLRLARVAVDLRKCPRIGPAVE